MRLGAIDLQSPLKGPDTLRVGRFPHFSQIKITEVCFLNNSSNIWPRTMKLHTKTLHGWQVCLRYVRMNCDNWRPRTGRHADPSNKRFAVHIQDAQLWLITVLITDNRHSPTHQLFTLDKPKTHPTKYVQFTTMHSPANTFHISTCVTPVYFSRCHRSRLKTLAFIRSLHCLFLYSFDTKPINWFLRTYNPLTRWSQHDTSQK